MRRVRKQGSEWALVLRFWLWLVLLLPALVAQAFYTRRRVLHLPDAEGPSAGTTNSGASGVRLLVMGESTTAGVGAEHSEQALPAQLARALAEQSGLGVHWCADGVTGCKLADVAQRLRQHPPEADLVVIFSGVNDTTALTALTEWRGSVENTVQLARTNGARVVLLAVPPMAHFTALPRPLRTLAGMRAQLLNRVMRSVAERQEGCDFIDWQIPATADHLASDGYHPSATGYRAIARDCARRITERGIR